MKRRLFTILSALSLLLFVAVAVLWVRSRGQSPTVQYVLPDGYRGYFWVVEDAHAGEEVIERDGRTVLRIPENGILRVKDLSIFRNWHRIEAQYKSGERILPLGERPVRPSDVVVWELGESGTEAIVFLVGTQAERDAYYTDEGRRAAFRLYVERLAPSAGIDP